MLKSSKIIRQALDDWPPEQKQQFLKAFKQGDWDLVSELTAPFLQGCCQMMRTQITEELAWHIEEGHQSSADYDLWLSEE